MGTARFPKQPRLLAVDLIRDAEKESLRQGKGFARYCRDSRREGALHPASEAGDGGNERTGRKIFRRNIKQGFPRIDNRKGTSVDLLPRAALTGPVGDEENEGAAARPLEARAEPRARDGGVLQPDGHYGIAGDRTPAVFGDDTFKAFDGEAGEFPRRGARGFREGGGRPPGQAQREDEADSREFA